jgi:hypothetical protein
VAQVHSTRSTPIELYERGQEGEPTALVSWGFEKRFSIAHDVD